MSLFCSYEPRNVEYLTPIARPSDRHFVQNLAYLCWTFGAAGINCDNPRKIIERSQRLFDISFKELFEEVSEPENIHSTDPEELMHPTHYLTLYDENKLLVVLNPAPYQAIPVSYYRYIDYFIPNEHELEQFTDEATGNPAMRAKYLVNKGLKNVIVTLGEEGSLYVSKDKVLRIEPNVVNAVDTTGAGDSYCAAFVVGLNEGKTLEEAMNFASKVSSITVTRKGAISSLPKRSEIRELFEQSN